ncbi:hypothetical protein M271_20435 [Streptomyces rapamycinicus NRRL 5491]|nr:hypothetical protein M271_20435 [Streptomyces rapamycinicus NRRL 5491]
MLNVFRATRPGPPLSSIPALLVLAVGLRVVEDPTR